MNLLETSLFRGVNPAELPVLRRELGAAERSFHKGQVILRQGEPAERLGLACAGRVLLTQDDVWGGSCALGSAGPGEVFAAAYACVPDAQQMHSVGSRGDDGAPAVRSAAL